MIVNNYDEAKKALLAGELVWGPRQCGKTTALVDVVAEQHNGDAVVVTTESGTYYFKQLYRVRHPEKPMPTIMSSRYSVNGLGREIYADNYDSFLTGDKMRLRPMLTAGIRGA